MIGNVLAHVSNGSIRTHDDLGILVGTGAFLFRIRVPRPFAFLWRKGGIHSLRRGRPLHHPAALVLAFVLEIEDALLFQLLEGRIPEVQAEDLAFAWQEIVLDVETVHGLQMTAQYGRRDQFRCPSHVIVTVLDGMQSFKSNFKILFAFFVPPRGPRVKVPTVKIKTRR